MTMANYDPRQMGPPRPGALAQQQMGPPQGMPPAPGGMPALGGQGTPPMLDSRVTPQRPRAAFEEGAAALRKQVMDPNKQRLAYQLGSMIGPALVGKLAGGSMRDAALYGVGSAAFNYQQQLSAFKDTERQIATAGMQIPQQEATYDLTRARTYQAMNPQLQPGSDPTLVQSTFKGANGNMWAVLRNGERKDLEVPYQPNVDPSSAEERLLVMMGKDGYTDYKRSVAAAGASGKMAPGIEAGLVSSFAGLEQTEREYTEFLKTLDKIDTNVISGKMLPSVNSEFQVARQQSISLALKNIGTLSAQGIRLNPITENELRILMATQPELTNNTAANRKITISERKKIRGLMADLRDQLNWIRDGGRAEHWRPKSFENYSQGDPEGGAPRVIEEIGRAHV